MRAMVSRRAEGGSMLQLVAKRITAKGQRSECAVFDEDHTAEPTECSSSTGDSQTLPSYELLEGISDSRNGASVMI